MTKKLEHEDEEREVSVMQPIMLYLPPEDVRFYDDYAKKQDTTRARVLRAVLKEGRIKIEKSGVRA